MKDQPTYILGISLQKKTQWRKCCIEKYEILPTSTEQYSTMSREIIYTIDYFGNEFMQQHVGKNLIHFGPNGSGTGFVLILNGQYDDKAIANTMQKFYAFLDTVDDSGIDTTDFDLPGAQWTIMYYVTMLSQVLRRHSAST